MALFEPIEQVVKDLCLRTGDILQRKKGLYLSCAKDVFYDLNLTSVKIAKRELFQINKRTNTIDMAKSFLQISSVNVMDCHGRFFPVFMSDTIHDDIVEVGAAKDCNCEFKCGYKLCNTVKGYEAITSIKTDSMPDGSSVSFACVDRKAIDANGFFYSETQYPKRIYTNGVWTNTVLYTENKKLCKVEVDKNGCVCDTDENINNVCNACGYPETNTNLSQTPIPVGGNAQVPPEKHADTWMYYCSTKYDWFAFQCGCHHSGKQSNYGGRHWDRDKWNVYNITEERNRLIFPKDFCFDWVMVRWYEDVSLRDLQVPFMVKPVFMKGLQWFATTNNEKKIKEAMVFERQYTSMKFGLLEELNKYRIAEARMIFTPPVKVPSYIDPRRDRRGGGY